MFQLLQPIWLFALAGLSIPVIIHLWNRQPGRVLKIGSIALLKENTRSDKKRIQPTEIWLLLLRCLLLACLAVALAAPFLKHAATASAKGWILMDRQDLPHTYQHFKPQVDALLAAGLEFHYLEEGFKKEIFEKALQLPANTAGGTLPLYRNITELLNEQVSAQLPLYVFTDNYLHHFEGVRRPASLNLHWLTYTPDAPAAATATDTTTLRVTIFSNGYSNDARYLEAALLAVQQFSKKNISIKTVTAPADIPLQQEWLCWLADAAPPKEKKAKHVLRYAKGAALKRASFILPATGNAAFTAVALYKSIIEIDSSQPFFTACWQDGFGHPLLTVQQQDDCLYYRLYTHFDPSWNELPWSDDFPAMLYKLLYADPLPVHAAEAADRMIIDSTQLLPVAVNEKEAGKKPAVVSETRLGTFCWLIVFVLFFAERCLSFYHRKTTADG